MSRIPRPSPAMVVAFTALVLAAGGTSYAAVKLPAKSVGTPQLKNNAVTTPKLKNNAVTTPKLKNASISRAKLQPDSVNGAAIASQSIEANHVKQNALSGVEIDEGTLGPVPNAVTAGIGGLSYVPGNVPLSAGMASTARQDCPATFKPIAGGVKVSDTANLFVIDTYPQGNGWVATVANTGTTNANYTVYAVCAQAGAGAGTAPKPAKPIATKRFRFSR